MAATSGGVSPVATSNLGRLHHAPRHITEDRQLLTLLASGFKDEAIARYLGWGLRTVRRRVATMMTDLGADTRFQLGAAAQRRGLLDTDRHPTSG